MTTPIIIKFRPYGIGAISLRIIIYIIMTSFNIYILQKYSNLKYVTAFLTIRLITNLSSIFIMLRNADKYLNKYYESPFHFTLETNNEKSKCFIQLYFLHNIVIIITTIINIIFIIPMALIQLIKTNNIYMVYSIFYEVIALGMSLVWISHTKESFFAILKSNKRNTLVLLFHLYIAELHSIVGKTKMHLIRNDISNYQPLTMNTEDLTELYKTVNMIDNEMKD